MRALADDEIALAPVASASEGQAPRSQLLVQGRPTGVTVAGAVLEAAFAWQRGWLLFATDDIPSEDSLHITLLDESLRVLDQATLGSAYVTGRFALLEPDRDDRVRFRFMGDTDWSVELLPAPGWRWPLGSEPRGVGRLWGWRRHFVVRGQPQAVRA